MLRKDTSDNAVPIQLVNCLQLRVRHGTSYLRSIEIGIGKTMDISLNHVILFSEVLPLTTYIHCIPVQTHVAVLEKRGGCRNLWKCKV